MKIKQAILFVLVFAVGLVTGLIWNFGNEIGNQGVVAEDLYIRELSFDFGGGDILKLSDVLFTGGENLFSVTEREVLKEELDFEYENYSALGNLITKIGDKINGEDGKYWQYWVNGKYAEVGAVQYQLKNSDIIEWKFVGYEEEQ